MDRSPVSLRHPNLSIGQFRSSLKTHYFLCRQRTGRFCVFLCKYEVYSYYNAQIRSGDSSRYINLVVVVVVVVGVVQLLILL